MVGIHKCFLFSNVMLPDVQILPLRAILQVCFFNEWFILKMFKCLSDAKHFKFSRSFFFSLNRQELINGIILVTEAFFKENNIPDKCKLHIFSSLD